MASWILNIYSWSLKTGKIITKFRMLKWIFWNKSITPTVRQNLFLLRNISRVGIPKSTVLVIIFRVFLWLLSLQNTGPISIIHLQCIGMVSQKRQDRLLQAIWIMEFLCHILILPQHPRARKISVTRLTSKRKNIFYILKQRMMHCLRIGQK